MKLLALPGSKKQSEPHILFSSNKRMCQQGEIDNFIIRTRESLGEITHVIFWHDDYGESPEW